MIKYKNYVIEANSEGGYALSEIKINKVKNEEYKANTCYPSTLKGCITKIINWEFAKVVKEFDYTLNEAIVELDRIHNTMTKFLKENIKEEIE